VSVPPPPRRPLWAAAWYSSSHTLVFGGIYHMRFVVCLDSDGFSVPGQNGVPQRFESTPEVPRRAFPLAIAQRLTLQESIQMSARYPDLPIRRFLTHPGASAAQRRVDKLHEVLTVARELAAGIRADVTTTADMHSAVYDLDHSMLFCMRVLETDVLNELAGDPPCILSCEVRLAWVKGTVQSRSYAAGAGGAAGEPL
jgi:transglutaminase-like putative cysteine protease